MYHSCAVVAKEKGLEQFPAQAMIFSLIKIIFVVVFVYVIQMLLVHLHQILGDRLCLK